MPPTTSHIQYCDKCHLPTKTPKVCNECGTASYCVRILATAPMSTPYIESTCRPLSPKEVWGITVLPGPPGHPPQFQHELLTINHHIFLKDGNKQNICLGSLLCGVPLLWYRSEQVQLKRTLERHGALGIHPETNPTAAADSMSTPEESVPTRHAYSPSSSNVKPHMTGAISRRSGLGLRCITSISVSENPPTGESTQQASDSPPKYNLAAALLCVDLNTGVTPDHFDGPRELIEAIWKFHCSIKEDSEKAEYNWATMSDLMSREAFQSFQSEYYLEQTAKGRPGFDPL